MSKLTIPIILILLAGCSTPRPWTRGELVLAGMSVAAAAWETIETERFLERPNTYEMNPLLGRHPSDGRLFATAIASEAVFLAIVHRWPTITLPVFGECEFRVPLLIGKTALNTGLAIHNRGVGK